MAHPASRSTWNQTEQHVQRLEQVFEQMEMAARGRKCLGMQHLTKEGQDMMADAEDADTRDALMIAVAQKIEHYEIATYGTLRVWASLLGHTEVASLFEETLEEEKTTDRRLTGIAESSVNEAAAGPGDQDEDHEQPRAAERDGVRRTSQARVSQMGGARSTRQQVADRVAASGRRR